MQRFRMSTNGLRMLSMLAVRATACLILTLGLGLGLGTTACNTIVSPDTNGVFHCMEDTDCKDGYICHDQRCYTPAAVAEAQAKGGGSRGGHSGDGSGGTGTTNEGGAGTEGGDGNQGLKPEPCTPNCGAAVCGPDGCGGQCGSCPDPQVCAEGACICPDNHETVCYQGNVWWVNGCGDMTNQRETCAWGCERGTCLACQPDCTNRDCGDDGCGGSCGYCDQGRSCSGNNVCVCTPEAAKVCHLGNVWWQDGCGRLYGGVLQSCSHGCRDGTCLDCVPNCDGLSCGDDGCGGSCGDCQAPTNGMGTHTCTDGSCVMTCPQGMHACEPGCVSDQDVAHCGNRCDPCPEPPENGRGVCNGDGSCSIVCNDGFQPCDNCATPTCQPCGGASEPCCGGSMCANSGMSCIAGVCQCAGDACCADGCHDLLQCTMMQDCSCNLGGAEGTGANCCSGRHADPGIDDWRDLCSCVATMTGRFGRDANFLVVLQADGSVREYHDGDWAPVFVSNGAPIGKVDRITAGADFACGRVRDNAWCWASFPPPGNMAQQGPPTSEANRLGELGRGHTRTMFAEREAEGPVLRAGGEVLQEVTHIAAGGRTACALTGPGVLWCWGLGTSGMLPGGSGLHPHSAYAVKIQEAAERGSGAVTDATALALGDGHGCFIRRDQTVWCWGNNASGQLAAPDTVSQSATPRSVSLPHPAIALAAGPSHNCAVTSEGEVWCWGDNFDGGVGAVQQGPVRAPHRVLGPSGSPLSKILKVAASDQHTCVHAEAGVEPPIWCWGRAAGGATPTSLNPPLDKLWRFGFSGQQRWFLAQHGQARLAGRRLSRLCDSPNDVPPATAAMVGAASGPSGHRVP